MIMRKFNIIFLLLLVMQIVNMPGCKPPQEDIQHFKVYYEPGMFGGWPANYGIWIWGNEILVGFSKGYHKDLGPEFHNIDREKPELHMLARSLDGGETWSIEDPGKKGSGYLVIPDHGALHGVMREDVQPPDLIDCSEAINFEHPDFAFTARLTSIHGGESRYWYSYDRGHNWQGPCALPDFNTPGTAARTDYIVDSQDECMLFITAAKSNEREGRPMVVKTTDGGINWSFKSWIGPEPEGFSIMPASARLSDNEILVTVRCREGPVRYISAYYSDDNGSSWTYLNNPAESAGVGNPPAMIRMHDGRICLVYGYRATEADIRNNLATSDIRAKISSDKGKTWSEDYILRSDGSGQDIGYPRVVQRPDGKIVVLYYFMDAETGPERYIAATVWDPPAPGN